MEKRFIGINIIKAINICHEHNVIHRDLKLNNIVICPNSLKIKLIDFGYGKIIDPKNDRQKKKCGTPYYLSPEIISEEIYSGIKNDIWSFGVIYFYLISENFPFKTEKGSKKVLFNKILNLSYKFDSNFRKADKFLLKRIFIKNYEKRPSSSQILKFLLDNWN